MARFTNWLQLVQQKLEQMFVCEKSNSRGFEKKILAFFCFLVDNFRLPSILFQGYAANIEKVEMCHKFD